MNAATFTTGEAGALLALALAAIERESEPVRRATLLHAVDKLAEQISDAALRAIADLTQPQLPAAPKRGRPPGARNRKPKQQTLPVEPPAATPQNSGAL